MSAQTSAHVRAFAAALDENAPPRRVSGALKWAMFVRGPGAAVMSPVLGVGIVVAAMALQRGAQWSNAFLLLAAFAALVCVVPLVLQVRTLLRFARLLRDGVYAAATLETEFAVGNHDRDRGPRIARLTFSYQRRDRQTPSLLRVRARDALVLVDDDKEPLLYDPARDDAVLLDEIPGEPRFVDGQIHHSNRGVQLSASTLFHVIVLCAALFAALLLGDLL